ncbi:UDP-N-acetylglucosamine 1-carboxyvinyltransferase [Ructibacterium gallinarum]|uniref:UDP-N-acetylglucosamine 1-carboxyvinyltransferase n=1 Tax=Ructibacterium gallinarum TaxID=2779355 RepID=A0A9D5M3X7_9FIRM|nr:UDP-N-acetylglucosamine 1-carboxyvinyltransferase [Ructibacterium gallinarum]MBE5040160.1 UDP-N-acetylglucosamine 1-carboxyvinyltransferase [Ructibacterium gallinarum]
MAQYLISPPQHMKGTIAISGSKNASLPILAAGLLCESPSFFENIPCLSDTQRMEQLLTCAGGICQRESFGTVSVCLPDGSKRKSAPLELVSKLRASFLVMGPLLARTGKIRIPLPGGCQIGARPIDLHLKGFAALGAKIRQGHGYVEAKCDHLTGTGIYLDFPSVGATENLMLAASLADGTTVIENAAAEPEIVDLAECLIKMGADVTGAGTDTITIIGKKVLSPCRHKVIPDRIEAGTFLAMAAAARGDVTLTNVRPSHVKPVIAKLEEMGFDMEAGEDMLHILPCEKFKAVDIKTLPYPGFPTDMQSQFMALMSVADGTGVIVETIFENRFMQVPELLRMGAKIKIDGRTAVIDGARRLSGAQVKATDLRAGASLVIAALAAQGDTIINDIEHMERGYENFVEKLTTLNINIQRCEN